MTIDALQKAWDTLFTEWERAHQEARDAIHQADSVLANKSWVPSTSAAARFFAACW